MLSRIKARMLLETCVGNEIWSVAFCQEKGIPQDWMDALSECFESGFAHDSQTIYRGEKVVNQFHGVRDRDLAFRLAQFLGVDTERIVHLAFGPIREVQLIKEAVEEEAL